MSRKPLITRAKEHFARGLIGVSLIAISMVHWATSAVWRVTGRRCRRPRTVFLVGAFYNPGWLLAHAVPLVRTSGIESVVVICDERLDLEVDGLRFCCASDQLKGRFGRGAARVITLFKEGIRCRPEVIMGYHIMPNAPLVLLAAAILNSRAFYQMTGGPGQIVGGGYGSESPILSAMGGPSPFVEWSVCHLVRCFDAVVVRGQLARRFVNERRISRNCIVLTGAIELSDYRVTSFADRKIDLIYVCRLVREVKGLEPFFEMLRELVRMRESLSVMIVGDGPDRGYFEKLACGYDLDRHVTFAGQSGGVPELLGNAKVFCLLSPSEGMSIAMLEAMAAGLPVVVTDVGELGDAVRDRGNGNLIGKENAAETAAIVASLLNDPERWQGCSAAARKVIEDSYSVESVAAIWNRAFAEMPHDQGPVGLACAGGDADRSKKPFQHIP